MKNLQSIEEGKWIELVSVELTDAEKLIATSTDSADDDAKIALAEKIKNDRQKSISATIASKAKAKYNEIKPTLNTNDVYELIAANFVFDDTNIVAGILNYRINGEHKQIRF